MKLNNFQAKVLSSSGLVVAGMVSGMVNRFGYIVAGIGIVAVILHKENPQKHLQSEIKKSLHYNNKGSKEYADFLVSSCMKEYNKELKEQINSKDERIITKL